MTTLNFVYSPLKTLLHLTKRRNVVSMIALNLVPRLLEML